MLERHLETVTEELAALDGETVLAFGLKSILRQAKVVELFFSNITSKIASELLDMLDEIKENFGSRKSSADFIIENYDVQILELTQNENFNSEQTVFYGLLGNMVDFLDAYFQWDIAYIKEYSAYRNFAAIELCEELLFNDIADTYEEKAPRIKELILDEISRQVEDLESLKACANPGQLSEMVSGVKDRPLFEMSRG